MTIDIKNNIMTIEIETTNKLNTIKSKIYINIKYKEVII